MNAYDGPKRGRGRPKSDPRTLKGTNGNPLLQARVPAEVGAWVRSLPGGLRGMILAAWEFRQLEREGIQS